MTKERASKRIKEMSPDTETIDRMWPEPGNRKRCDDLNKWEPTARRREGRRERHHNTDTGRI
jgi:hypothetical protein